MGHRSRRFCALLFSLLVLVADPALAQETLPHLAEVGPWPAVSRLVGYRGRLWFANSVKGRNHNSADLYSYEAQSGELRYEWHLFSQDAGRPLVYDGRLYWPYEDSRASLGWGEVLVTDGEAWRAVIIPTAEIYHVHGLAAAGGRLVAATSAWRAGLQLSEDGGASWRELYDRPTPAGRVSRIAELIAVNGRLLAYLTQRGRRAVLAFDGAAPRVLAGWPEDAALRGWARFGGWVYALVETAAGVAVWRSDGARSEVLTPPRPDWRPRALAADGRALWAVGAAGEGGLLWRSADGRRWEAVRRIEGGRPLAVLAYRGFVFVGGAGGSGKGQLWGAPIGARGPDEDAAPAAALEDRASSADRQALIARLEAALGEPASYRGHGEELRDLVYALAMTHPPAAVWRELFARPVPDITLSLIGGETAVAAQGLARWILLWGLALAGEGRVPADWLRAPWRGETNPAEKYFAAAPMAIWAAARVGQGDRASLEALVARLARPDDPLWLRGDVVGALTALTGRRFGYDVAAWQAWWAAQGK